MTTCSFMRINGLRKDISISCSLIQCLFLMEFKENSLSVNLFCVLCIHFKRRKQKVFNFFALYPSPSCCCLVLFFFTLYRCLFYSYGSKNFAIKIFSSTIYPFVVYGGFIASRTLFLKYRL